MEAYNEFAYIYDELMNDFDYEKWAGYINSIFKKYKKDPKNILEMACGTGNLTYHLAREGYRLTAFDLSEEMLAQAYKKLGRYKNVELLNLDMIEFDLNKKYDSVISICDSINYILEEEDLASSFENVYRHLEEDGIFIFDINSYYKLKNIIGNNTFINDQEETFYTWQNFYDDEVNICDFFLTFFVREKDGKYSRFEEEHSEKAYKIKEIVRLLKEAGFKNIDYYEGFTFDGVVEKTQRINFVALK